MKQCKKCTQILSFEYFTKSKNTKDGYENMCKICRQEQRKKYYNTCLTCGKQFKTASQNSKYCSQGCKPQSQKKRVFIKCSFCGKEKEVTKSHKELYQNLYCSNLCKDKHYKELYSGENSPKYNKKKVNCSTCRKEFKISEYELNKYTHHFCSKKCRNEKYKSLFSGSKNPNYNPLKPEKERICNRNIEGYNEWVRLVFKKDNYTCQNCNDATGGNLNAHHIKNYSEHKDSRLDVNNGITLCKKCHKLFHDTYGYKRNTLNQLNEFLYKYDNTEPSS